MTIERLTMAENRIERIDAALRRLAAQVAAVAQQLWQQAGGGQSGGGGGGLRRIRIDTGISAGAMGAPATADAFLLNIDGTDGTAIDLNSEFSVAITGSTYGWAQLVGSDYYLVQADC